MNRYKTSRIAPMIMAALLAITSVIPVAAMASDDQSAQLDKESLEFVLAIKRGLRIANEAYENKEYAEAFPLYEALASKGLDLAEFKLGRMYELGLGVKVDLNKAARLYEPATEKGNVEAMFYLARFHFNGLGGLKEDFREGLRLWYRASNLDHAPSAYALGSAMMKMGKKDLGYEQIKLAAYLKHPEAQLEMAKIIMVGDSPKNESSWVLANSWALAALMNGIDEGKELIELIEPNLSNDEKKSAARAFLSLLRSIKKFNGEEL